MSRYLSFELSYHHKGLANWMLKELLTILPEDATLSRAGDMYNTSSLFLSFTSKEFDKLDEASMIPSIRIIPDYQNKALMLETTNEFYRELFKEYISEPRNAKAFDVPTSTVADVTHAAHLTAQEALRGLVASATIPTPTQHQTTFSIPLGSGVSGLDLGMSYLSMPSSFVSPAFTASTGSSGGST